jgi:hypothetical protein
MLYDGGRIIMLESLIINIPTKEYQNIKFMGIEELKNIEIKNGWKNETEKYSLKIVGFVSNLKGEDYDHITEFHISGMNSDVLEKMKNGTVNPEKVEVYYEKDIIKNFHVLYNGEDRGQNIDLYISGRALEDFLNN